MTRRFPKNERKKIKKYIGMIKFFPGKGGRPMGVGAGSEVGPVPTSVKLEIIFWLMLPKNGKKKNQSILLTGFRLLLHILQCS